MNGGQVFAPGDEFEYQGTPEQAEQDVADGLIEIRRVVANFVKTEGPTLAELRAEADRLGIKYKAKTTKAQLTELLAEATIPIAAEDAEIQSNGEIVVTDEGAAKQGEPTVNPEDDGA